MERCKTAIEDSSQAARATTWEAPHMCLVPQKNRCLLLSSSQLWRRFLHFLRSKRNEEFLSQRMPGSFRGSGITWSSLSSVSHCCSTGDSLEEDDSFASHRLWDLECILITEGSSVNCWAGGAVPRNFECQRTESQGLSMLRNQSHLLSAKL